MSREESRSRLDRILRRGIARAPLEHARQVAEIAGVLHDAFEAVGLRCTLVGGSAIEIHAPGVYTTGDLDVVIETQRVEGASERVAEVFTQLGFKGDARHWVRGELFVEVPSHVLSDPAEKVRVANAVFRVVAKEVVLADRIVGFKHWQYTAYGQQAIAMLAAFGERLNMAWLKSRLQSEHCMDAFLALKDLAESGTRVTEKVVRALLVKLRGRSSVC